jgi:type I pantothenate kinase
MDQLNPPELSPYQTFSEAEWAGLRADTPMTLTDDEIEALQGFNDRVEPGQVESIYLPLSRLLSLYVEAAQGLHAATSRFLGHSNGKIPFVIGVAGSVAVGKSTTARVLQALLGRWPSTPNVALVPTDGFLYPNAVLEAEGLMRRKGFPESYDVAALLRFLRDIKSGRRRVEAPVYSHLLYDVIPGETIVIERPDILIIEGLNVLQTTRLKSERPSVPFVSDFFDFSVYIDASEDDLERWYIERFQRLKETRFRDPRSYFHQFASLSEAEALDVGGDLWRSINLVNLRENVGPTKLRADLILTKGSDHRVEQVALRKL